jgi:5-methylcytosine-specific restriction endonuclease McrA
MLVKRRRHKSILSTATKCFYCEREFNHPEINLNAGRKTIEHIIPLCYGGLDQKENIVIACAWCNNEKHNLSLDNFYKHIEKLKQTLPETTKNFISLETIKKNILILKEDENYIWVKSFVKKGNYKKLFT